MNFDAPSLEPEVRRILAHLRDFGPLIVFAALFVECVPLAGFAMPGLLILVAAGFIAAGEPVGAAGLLMLSAAAGVIAADYAGFWVGRLGYERIPSIRRMVDKRIRLKAHLLARSSRALLFYQFPPYTRMFAPLLLGAAGYSPYQWSILVVASSSLFVIAFFGLGFAAGWISGELMAAAQAASVISALFVFTLLIWIVHMAVTLRRGDRPSNDVE